MDPAFRSRHVRLAALGVWHEANTFVSELMDEATMQANGVLRGEAIGERHAAATTSMAGFLAAGAADDDVEVVPLVMATLVPRGRITADALANRVAEIRAAFAASGPFDGILAALHGAAVAEDVDDVDGFLLGVLREVAGPDVPIGAALDLHANISAAMCERADVVNTYRTNPHLDAHVTGREVADLVIAAARGDVRPVVARVPIPAVINILRQNTDTAPMSDVMAAVRSVMERPGILSATVAEGFPYADVAEMGMCAVAVADGDRELAEVVATELAEFVWARRDQLWGTAPSVDEAIAHVAAATSTPVLLLDAGDNIGGGSPGDSVALLAAARRAGLADLLVIVADPAAVEACTAVGPGAAVELSIGGHSDVGFGPPVVASATVTAFDDGVFAATGEAVHAGMDRLDAGASTAVVLDTGQTVILTSNVTPPFSILQLTRLGLDPAAFRAIVAKGVHSPRATYAPYVAEMLMVATPGPTAADVSTFAYLKRRRPLHPFEPDAQA